MCTPEMAKPTKSVDIFLLCHNRSLSVAIATLRFRTALERVASGYHRRLLVDVGLHHVTTGSAVAEHEGDIRSHRCVEADAELSGRLPLVAVSHEVLPVTEQADPGEETVQGLRVTESGHRELAAAVPSVPEV